MKIILQLIIVTLFFNSINAALVGTQVSSRTSAIQANNRIVAAGFSIACDHTQFMVARYNTDGTPDGTFNGAGSVVTLFGGNARVNSIAIQSSDQKIVAVGNSDDTVALARYLPSGALDTNFGSGGLANLDVGQNEAARAITFQSSKPLIAGNATVGGINQFLVARFSTIGVLDTTFGTSSGYTLTPIGDGAQANAIGIQASSGKIVLAGTAVVSGQPQFALARYSASGVLDTTFGSSGITLTPIGTNATVQAMVIDATNRIFVAGISVSGGLNRVAVARYTANGALDATFGASGIAIIDIPGVDPDQGFSIGLQTDGKIVVSGNSNGNVLVARLTSSGILDTTAFGVPNGYVTTSVGSDANGFSLVIQPTDQKIVVVGFSDSSSVALRYDVDGTLDTTWNSTGITIAPSGSPAFTCGTIGGLGLYGYLFNDAFNIALSTSDVTPIPFTSEGPLFNISHSTITNPDQITILNSGTYLVTAVVNLSASGTGVAFSLIKNTTDTVPGSSYALEAPGNITIQSILTANANDIIQLVETGLVSQTIIGKATIILEKIA